MSLVLILDVLLIMLFILKGVMTLNEAKKINDDTEKKQTMMLGGLYISIGIIIGISTLILMSGIAVSLVGNGVYRIVNKSKY